MARLIDADALHRKVKMETNPYGKPTIDYDSGVKVLEWVDKAPTIGAVEVVRCKDCKHYMPQKKSAHWENRANYCNRIVTIKTQPYDFCSYGERKNEVSE